MVHIKLLTGFRYRVIMSHTENVPAAIYSQVLHSLSFKFEKRGNVSKQTFCQSNEELRRKRVYASAQPSHNNVACLDIYLVGND